MKTEKRGYGTLAMVARVLFCVGGTAVWGPGVTSEAGSVGPGIRFAGLSVEVSLLGTSLLINWMKSRPTESSSPSSSSSSSSSLSVSSPSGEDVGVKSTLHHLES